MPTMRWRCGGDSGAEGAGVEPSHCEARVTKLCCRAIGRGDPSCIAEGRGELSIARAAGRGDLIEMTCFRGTGRKPGGGVPKSCALIAGACALT